MTMTTVIMNSTNLEHRMPHFPLVLPPRHIKYNLNAYGHSYYIATVLSTVGLLSISPSVPVTVFVSDIPIQVPPLDITFLQ